jgi:hypothetical protein
MTRADNARFLARAASDRHHVTVSKASNAIEHLDSSGQTINFSTVAAAAGVSRAWLYRHPDIRDLISRLRSAPARSATPQAIQRASAESLRGRLHAARAQITRLQADNTMLREQLARQLGEQRTAIRHSSPPAATDHDPVTRPDPLRLARHVYDAKPALHQGLFQTDLR